MIPATLTAAPAAVEPPARPASPWPVFWVSSVAIFLVSLDTTMLYAAFGALRAGFPDASAADMSWVLNAYTVVYAAMLIPAGGLADTHGRKRVFLLGVTLFIAASALCGLAGNVGWLIAARVLQAVGAALLTPASLSIVLAAFPQSRARVTVSLWGAVGRLRRRGRAEPRLVHRADHRLAVGLLHQPADRRDVAVVGCFAAARIGPRQRASHASTAWAWRCSSSPSARSRSPSSKRTRRAGPARSFWGRRGTGVIALAAFVVWATQRARAARRPGAVPPSDLQRGRTRPR